MESSNIKKKEMTSVTSVATSSIMIYINWKDKGNKELFEEIITHFSKFDENYKIKNSKKFNKLQVQKNMKKLYQSTS